MLWQEFNKRYKDKVRGFPMEQRMIYQLTQLKIGKGI